MSDLKLSRDMAQFMGGALLLRSTIKVLLFGSFTGDYIFCCDTFSVSGKGTVKKKGNTTFTLTHNPSDRSESAGCCLLAQHKGNASLQIPPGTQVCTIQDRDFRNNSCICRGSPNGE